MWVLVMVCVCVCVWWVGVWVRLYMWCEEVLQLAGWVGVCVVGGCVGTSLVWGSSAVFKVFWYTGTGHRSAHTSHHSLLQRGECPLSGSSKLRGGVNSTSGSDWDLAAPSIIDRPVKGAD